MPGPGLDLVGEEQLADVADVVRSCHLPCDERDAADTARRQAERSTDACREVVV